MIYDHVVKINGEYYQAGEEVPELNQDTIESSEFNCKSTKQNLLKEEDQEKVEVTIYGRTASRIN